MTEKEKENRIRWYYQSVFNKSIRSKYVERVTCYIFSTDVEKKRFAKEHDLKQNWNVLLLTEGDNPCLVRRRIGEVNLISSIMPEVIEEVCRRAIYDGYGLNFNNYMDKRY